MKSVVKGVRLQQVGEIEHDSHHIMGTPYYVIDTGDGIGSPRGYELMKHDKMRDRMIEIDHGETLESMVRSYKNLKGYKDA